jgi:hypothetical protein
LENKSLELAYPRVVVPCKISASGEASKVR